MIRLFNTEISPEEIEVVGQVLRTGSLVMGPHIDQFAAELELFHGSSRFFVPCASGTDALIMALEETGCTGHGVIVPAMTFSATYEAVLRAGAIPVICDIDDQTGTLSVDLVRSCIVDALSNGLSIAAVVIVHLYGWPAYDTLAVTDFCHNTNIRLIEDCAQAIGASIDGRPVGTFGDAAAFSFYPTKPLGGIGDGGAACFPSLRVARVAAAKRNHGRNEGVQEFAGYNSRLDEVNAAVLRHRLKKYSENMAMRRIISGRYHANGIKKMSIKRHGRGAPYVYPILVDSREEVRFKLADAGVETRVHYDPAVNGLPYTAVSCPNADFMARRVLSLPCHHGMTLEDVDRICDALRGSRGET